MSDLERRVNRLEKDAGDQEEPGHQVINPRLFALLRLHAESIGGPSNQKWLEEPIPYPDEEWREAQEWAKRQRERVAQMTREESLANAKRTVATASHPLLVEMAESIIRDIERDAAGPDQAEEARERATKRTVH